MKQPLKVLIAAGVLMLTAIIPATALAGDNSGIVVIERHRQVNPYGHYQSRRHLRVYGRGDHFRYETHRYAPRAVPVYPRYRPHRYRRNPRFAPRFGARNDDAWHRRRHGFDRYRRHHRREYGGRFRHHRHHEIKRFDASPSHRAIRPSHRAIEPAQRAIR